ncbi:hypothetical protein Trydic_g1716 [Trypoxylus dichotomus]
MLLSKKGATCPGSINDHIKVSLSSGTLRRHQANFSVVINGGVLCNVVMPAATGAINLFFMARCDAAEQRTRAVLHNTTDFSTPPLPDSRTLDQERDPTGNLGDVADEHGEKFYQDINQIELRENVTKVCLRTTARSLKRTSEQ